MNDRVQLDKLLKDCPFCGAHGTVGWFATEANASCDTLDCPGSRGASAYLDDHGGDESATVIAACEQWNKRA